MSNELQTVKTFSLVPENLDQAMKLASIMAESDMVPKDFRGKPGNVLVAVQMGAEIGLPPAQALQNIAVINGRPSLWGDAALAVVKGHPRFEAITETFDESTQTATCTIKRRGENQHTSTFSMADAKLAGLAGKQGPWTQYPKRMLQMRARSFAIRDVFPDALKGISIAEEAQDIPERDITAAAGPAERTVEPARPALEECSAEKFAQILEKHKPLIVSGKKSPADLIAWLSAKTILTEEQKLTIDSWAHEGDE